MSVTSDRYDPSNIDEILNQDWQEVFPRVLKYAIARSRKYYWIGDASVNPEDLVNEAVARALGIGNDGTYRNWNKDKYPGIVNFLISIIDSMTNHEAEHAFKFRNEPYLYEDGTEKISTQTEDNIHSKSMDCDVGDLQYSNKYNIEETMIIKQEYDLLVMNIKAVAAGDEEMEMILMCIEDDISKPAEISSVTGYDIKIVYKVLRRLRSKLEAIKPMALKKGRGC